MRNLIAPIVGVSLLVGFFFLIDLKEIVNLIISAELAKILLGLVFGIFANIFTVIRWKIILKIGGAQFSFYWLLTIFGQGLSLNSVLPGGIVSGDVFRSFTIARLLPKTEKSLGPKSVLIDRCSGVWSVSVLSLVSAALIILAWQIELDHQIFAYYTLALLTITMAPFLLTERIISWLSKIQVKDKLFIKKLSVLINPLFHFPKYLLSTLWISILIQLLAVINFWFCLQAVGINISFLHLSFCSCFIFISSVIPISFAGFGPRELGSVAILNLYGFSAEALIVGSILYGLTTTVQGFICLIWYFKVDRNSNKEA